jgi:hypothetical protein
LPVPTSDRQAKACSGGWSANSQLSVISIGHWLLASRPIFRTPSGSEVCSQSAIGIGAEYNIHTIHTGPHIRKCKAIALSSWKVLCFFVWSVPVSAPLVGRSREPERANSEEKRGAEEKMKWGGAEEKKGGVAPERKRNREVPKRNLRISLNIAAGGTGFLRNSSRIETKFGRNSVLCELKRIEALPST